MEGKPPTSFDVELDDQLLAQCDHCRVHLPVDHTGPCPNCGKQGTSLVAQRTISYEPLSREEQVARELKEDARALLIGGSEGIKEWNRRRCAGLWVPSLAGLRLGDEHELPSDSEEPGRGLNLSGVDFSYLNLMGAQLCGVDLSGAVLRGANLFRASLIQARLDQAHLENAKLRRADLGYTSMQQAHFEGADLGRSTLRCADARGASFRDAILENADIVGTNLGGADLTGARVYGVSAWDVELTGSTQSSLVITSKYEPTITVDNLEVAQFIHLLLTNKKIRSIIDTITSKVVLILGRFTEERKAVLDDIREQLRRRGFTPVLFDFDKPTSKDATGTVETLARMARFIIADLTDPSSIPHELATTVPFLRTTPVLPLRLAGSGGYTMFDDLQRAYRWVLPVTNIGIARH